MKLVAMVLNFKMEGIVNLHHDLMFFITFILFFVFVAAIFLLFSFLTNVRFIKIFIISILLFFTSTEQKFTFRLDEYFN